MGGIVGREGREKRNMVLALFIDWSLLTLCFSCRCMQPDSVNMSTCVCMHV